MAAAILELETRDEGVIQRLLGGPRLPRPGARSEIRGGGLLVLESAELPEDPAQPALYRLVVEFASENGAAVVANTLFSALHGAGVTLRIGDLVVPLRNAAIKDALLAAVPTEP
jgi:hypothetical protein